MVSSVIDYRLDAVALALVVLAASAFVQRSLRRRCGGIGFGTATKLLLVAILLAGAFAADWAGSHERARMRDMLSGIAPTYAQEISLLGHASLPLDVSPDDPRYLRMIEAQIRWERVNPNVNDVYTFRKRPDGKVVLFVDSETDYDHDGEFEGERESRTSIGEVYEETTPNLMAAFDGRAMFDAEPYTDRWGTWVSAYVPLRDDKGNVEGVLGVDYDAGRWVVATAEGRLAALGMAALLDVILLAAASMVAVARRELDVRAAAERERATLQRQLVAASREAGMAEVATGVLHNVGNVLNSVVVSAGVIDQTLRNGKLPGLSKACDMIRDNRAALPSFLANDPRGKVLPDYLCQVAGVLGAERDSILKELHHLSDSVEHIKQVVASQQQFAKSTSLVEKVSLAEVVDEAVRLSTSASPSEAASVTIDRQYGDCAQADADRHKLLQILLNLVTNASRAVATSREKRVTIKLATVPATATTPALARLTVADSGVGITVDQMPKLFTHGYTTRAEGHGFGLHSSAIAAQQMGGRLYASSPGAGQGATFTLDLPLRCTTESNATRPADRLAA